MVTTTQQSQAPLPTYPSHVPLFQTQLAAPVSNTTATQTTAPMARPTLSTLNTSSSTASTSSATSTTPFSPSNTNLPRRPSRAQPKPNHPILSARPQESPTSTTTRSFPASFTAPQSAVIDPSLTSLGGYGPDGKNTPTSPTNPYNRKFSAFNSDSPTTATATTPTTSAGADENAARVPPSINTIIATNLKARNASISSARSPPAAGPAHPSGTFVRRQSNQGGKIATIMTYSNYAEAPSPTTANASIDERLAAATAAMQRESGKKGPLACVTEIGAENKGDKSPAEARSPIETRSPVFRDMMRGSVSSNYGRSAAAAEGKGRKASTILASVKEYLKPGNGADTA